MTPSRLRLPLAVCGGLILIAAGCGTSGSDPPLFAEVRFEIEPDRGTGEATFVAESLTAGGIEHRSLANTAFSTTATFSIVLENAMSPYRGTFRQVGEGGIRVRLIVTGQSEVIRFSTGPDSRVTVATGPPGAPILTPVPPTTEVRIDVCSGSPGPCFAGGDPGGVTAFSGTAGDPFVTHILAGSTPSIYFLEGVRDNINAIFRAESGALLSAQLHINQQRRQSVSGVADIVLREDL